MRRRRVVAARSSLANGGRGLADLKNAAALVAYQLQQASGGLQALPGLMATAAAQLQAAEQFLPATSPAAAPLLEAGKALAEAGGVYAQVLERLQLAAGSLAEFR